MEQDETGVARSQHVVHVLSPGDARVASVVGPQVQRADSAVEGVQVLVVTPSAEAAAWIARLVNPSVEAGQALLIPVTSPVRGARRISSGAHAVAASAADALALVRGSALKLDGVTTLVLIDAIELLAGEGDALATLLSEVPRDADRLLVTTTVDDTVSAFIESHMRRARRITHDPLPTSAGPLQYLVTPRSERASAMRRILDAFDPPRTTILADEPFASAASRALASIGYSNDDSLVRVRSGALDAHEPLVISFNVPQGAAALQLLADATPKAVVVLVAPEELAAFLRLAGPRSAPLFLSAAPAAARAAEETLRDELRAVMSARSLHRETLALEPLFAEHDAVEVAAAMLRMLELERERGRAKRPVRAAEAPAVSVPNERVAPVGTTFTKLFINVGERDGAKKGDFVGAITGETGLSADQIGKIDLRDSHTIADVMSDVAEKVIAALNGSTICGRHVLAREDRGPTEREGGEREARGGPPRGADRGFRGAPPARGGFRGNDRGAPRAGGGFRGASDRGDRGERGERGDRGDRGERGERGDRAPRSGAGGGFRGGGSGGFRSGGSGGFRSGGSGGGGGGGGFRSGDRDRGGFRGGERGPDRGPDRGAERGEPGGVRGGDRDRGGFSGGPPRRTFDRNTSSGPKAIGESREWSERGDRLRNSRGRRGD